VVDNVGCTRAVYIAAGMDRYYIVVGCYMCVETVGGSILNPWVVLKDAHSRLVVADDIDRESNYAVVIARVEWVARYMEAAAAAVVAAAVAAVDAG
jgi:hypothetical protein